MSEGYARETSLVTGESNIYDRALDTTIALTIVGFLLGMVTLVKLVQLDASGSTLTGFFAPLLAVSIGGIGVVALFSALGVVPITERRVRGVGIGLLVVLVGLTVAAVALPITLATMLGSVLIVEAVVILAASVASQQGIVDTEPSPSAGILAGGAFGVVGLLLGAAVGGTVLGTGPIASYGPALLVGVVFAVVTIAPREDLGTGIPVAALVGVLGLVIVTGTIDLGWTWSPGQNIDGDFTGEIVIPLFVLFGSMIASWGAAKSRAGYGARGRQYGAYLLVYLNALLMVTIMVSIVAFVTQKGIKYAIHDFQIGALSALVVLTPALVLAIDFARTKAGTDNWHSGARQFFRVAPLAALGSLAGLLLFVQARGEAFSIPFTYEVYVEREPVVLDTTAQITAEPTIGNLLIVFSGVFLVWYFLRKYGSLRNVGTFSERVATVERYAGIGMGTIVVFVAVLVFLGKQPFGVPLGGTVGFGVVVLAAVAATGLAGAALATLVAGSGNSVAERGHDRAQVVRVGIFGAMGLFVAAVLLEPTSGTVPTALGVNIVPLLTLLSAAFAAGVAIATARAARASEDESIVSVLQRESALGLAGTAGFVTITALHVALTGATYNIGPVSIGYLGTLSWPMFMDAYTPLGPVPGGITPAVVGTIWLVVGASLFAVPLGVGAAIFLTEYAEQGKFTAVVEVATNALWSTPSIVFGLFGAAFLIPRLGGQESLMAGQLVLGFMLLPLVLITSREAIKSVPDEYRDASAALGVNRWETIKSVVLPASLPGVITGVILGVGRIAGETAPLILVLGSTLNSTAAIDVLGGFQFVSQPPFITNPTLLEASAALPTQVWAVIAAGVSGSPSMGWASAMMLLMVVLSFYTVGIIARIYFRRKLNYE
jgi:phosphate transport system permease protein